MGSHIDRILPAHVTFTNAVHVFVREDIREACSGAASVKLAVGVETVTSARLLLNVWRVRPANGYAAEGEGLPRVDLGRAGNRRTGHTHGAGQPAVADAVASQRDYAEMSHGACERQGKNPLLRRESARHWGRLCRCVR